MNGRSAGANAHLIAVVGIGGRFAGAEDLHGYWQLCQDGRDAFGPVPADRWNHEAFYSENARHADKSYAPAGAWLDDVRSFPALTLQIPPRRVEVMDPQQRLCLEAALQAVQATGRTPEELPRRTGVYVGLTATEYRTLSTARVVAQLMAQGVLGEAPGDPAVLAAAAERVVQTRPFSATGLLANMSAATISQQFGLTGPAFSVDAACSSALIALHSAIGALRAGEIDVALAGGAYLCLTPEHHIAFSRIGAMSKQGRCLPFDARADGFVQGEGGAIVMLKRLDDALRDGDPIRAVVHGTALNNDGGGDGPMAPVKSGQIDVIRRAWRDAGVDPAQLGYVEAHGTGTTVGDQIEFDGLNEALGADARRVGIGSSKANVGHTMSAAGVAGFVRSVLALDHGVIPPMAGFEAPKQDLGLDGSPFHVPQEASEWTGEGRLAAVSAFGFGGTNAHLVLGAAPTVSPAMPAPPVATPQAELVCFSAPTPEALRRTACAMADALDAAPSTPVSAVVRALRPRHTQRTRAAIVAATTAELRERLRGIAAGNRPDGVTIGEADRAPRVAFLYPGQGAQRVGMIAGIRDRFPAVRQTLDRADQAVEGITERPVSHYLYPERRSEPVDADTAMAELTDTQHCQPALFAVGAALTQVLRQAGVEPTCVAGHSVGEFSAAWAGGVLSLEDGARWTAVRGRAMSTHEGDPGAMVAIVADEASVRSVLVDGAQIANLNHPRQIVVSGRTEAVEQVARAAEARDWKTVRLAVSHGFHSAVFEDLALDAQVDALTLNEPELPVASCIQQTPYASADEAREVFRAHATAPVRFTDTVAQCLELGVDLFLQVSAGGPLRSFVRGSVDDPSVAILSLASKDDADAGRSLLLGLGELYVRGVDVDAAALAAPGPVADLPPEILPREVYWVVKDSAQAKLKLEAVATPTAPEVDAVPLTVAGEEAAAADEPGASGVEALVIAAVARASAYPANALRADMTLADDLGFDSMMMADLVEELRKAIPGLPGIPQELLINGPTIADLVAFCEDPSSAEGAEADDDAPLSRYAPSWVATPRPDGVSRVLSGARVLVTGRDASVVDEVVAALEARDAKVTRHVAEDATPSDAVDAVIYACGGPALPPLNAVLAGEAPLPDLAGDWIAVLDAQAALGARPSVGVLYRDDVPWADGVCAVARSVAREWPETPVKALGFEGAVSADAQLTELLAEWSSRDTSVDVRFRADERFVAGATPLVETVEPWTPSADDIVVITGGTRGIGLELGLRLATHAAKVVLVGRGAPAADVLARAEEHGGKVVFARADVTDRDTLRAALASVGPVTTLVHAAGVLADGPLGTVDPKRGALARSVKVDGWLNAVLACGPSLRRALGIGSWAGRFGSRHQAHYAAGNAMLATLAARMPERVISACSEFGPWTDSEMAATIPEPVRQAMRAEGVDFVGNDAGLSALLEDLSVGGGAVVRGRTVPFTRRRVTRPLHLDTTSHPYLLDHAIEGRPVWPLAGAAAWMSDVAGVGEPFVLSDLTLFQGVVVDEPADLLVVADGRRVEVRSGDTLHYRAAVEPLRGDADVPEPLSGGQPPGELTLRAFYDDVTFHGPLLQGIESIDGIGEDFVHGTLRTGSPATWVPGTTMQRWTVDPLVLDSAMQLSAYVAWTRFGRAGTPVGIERLVQLAPLPEGRIRAEVRFGDSDDDRFSADITLRTLDGQPLAHATGVVAQLRAVAQAAATEAPDWGDFEVKPEWVNPAEFPGYKDLKLRQQMVAALGMQNPYFDSHDGTARNTSLIEGREVINFSSYNYLGLSGDPRVIADVHAAMHQYGTSVSASRIASGERPLHRDLEQALATAIGVQDAVIMPSGHATNVTTIGHLMGPNDLILHDELVHDSCLQGIKLSGAARRGFRHEDVAHAEAQLRELRPHYEKVLILKEGVYSMDGDIADIPEFIRLKKTYGCMLMVDEAHSFGTIGPNGFGVADHFDIDANDVDVWMGTMSKSLASMGGWIAGRAELVEYLKYTTPGFVFAAGMAPTLAQAALSSLGLMREERWRVEKLQHNSRFFYEALNARGINTGVAKGMSPVVPAITGDSMHALLLSQALLDDGVNAKPIIFPAVADDAARLRFFLSALHTEEELTRTADLIASHLQRIRAEHGKG